MSHSTASALTAALGFHQSGQIAEAEKLYRQFLADHPDDPDGCHLLGVLCASTGRAQEALKLLNHAIAIQPNADSYNQLGAAYFLLHDYALASECFRQALSMDPTCGEAHGNLGLVLLEQRHIPAAIACLTEALKHNPKLVETHYNLGNAFNALERYSEAEASYRQALALVPQHTNAMVNLSKTLRELKRLDEALALLQQAARLDPRDANTQLNLGTALRDVGRYEEAAGSLRRAIELRPQLAEAHYNLGTNLEAQARYPEALAAYEQALALHPQLSDAHFSHALYLLRQGDWERGFAEYECRFQCREFALPPLSEPRWDGSPLEGRTVLLRAEQGLGDTLQFVRFAADARSRGGKVVVQCPAALLKILATCPSIDRVVADGEPAGHFDVQAPLLSMPGILRLSPAELSGAPYLFADTALVERWRAALAPHDGFRVGICWQGNAEFMFDRQRSFALSAMAPLAGVAGVRLVSLQKGAGAQQLATSAFEVVDLGPQLDVEAGPFMDTAAVMKNLDLVITCDTSLGHLAGALGVPVWLALSAHSDWRWMMDRDDTPWYPTMRLFRQRQLDAWPKLFEQMAAALADRSSGRSR